MEEGVKRSISISTEPKKRTWIWLLVFIFLLVVIAIISIFILGKEQLFSTNLSSIKTDEEMIKFLSDTENFDENVKLLSKTPEECNKGDFKEITRVYCHMLIALGKEDIKYCENIPSVRVTSSGKSEQEEACKYMIQYCIEANKVNECIENLQNTISYSAIMEEIQSPENEEVCKQQENITYREICYVNLAKKTGDVSYCNKVSYVKSCIYEVAIATGKEELCLEVEKNKTEDCYYFIATRFGKLKLCLNLPDSRKKYCIWYTTKGTAINDTSIFPIRSGVYEREDILICNEAKEANSVIPKDCYYGIARNLGVDVCEELSGEDVAICYTAYASNTGEASKCGLISEDLMNSPDWTWIEECISELEKVKDAEECNQLPEGMRFRDRCKNKLALTSGESGECEDILDNDSRDVCYSNLAIKNKDETLCPKIISQNKKDCCYHNVDAGSGFSKNLCNNIVRADIKEWCENKEDLVCI